MFFFLPSYRPDHSEEIADLRSELRREREKRENTCPCCGQDKRNNKQFYASAGCGPVPLEAPNWVKP